ncbi:MULTISPECIES: MFS transporter [Streptomyces]|uniref:MFS transporter n=2 Tax=Streptomyces TaxID=1883 RepID=UPI000998E746|nr:MULTISPECIES: MFS transporter [unclassified Streptomyces]MYS69686.1 MFS transporter [Streptomyces sp. SID5926]NEC40884.1 MFS transporter [Streptomyces sp. SID8016]NEC64690.1 MFS transporter [Streptomyces sp. SID9727]
MSKATPTRPADIRDHSGPAPHRVARKVFGAAMDTRPLAVPAYRRLLAGQGLSYIGTAITTVAVPLEVYHLTRSSLYVGLTGLVGLVPLVIFGLYGGAVADRVDRRRLYLAASAMTWLVTVGLFAQALLETGSVGLLLVLVAAQSAAFAVSSAARGAIIPRVVPGELVSAANTLSQTAGNLGQVAGPLIAGALVALPHGYAVCYGLDALLFAALLYAAVRLPPITVQQDISTSSGVRMVWEGLRFIASHPVLWMSFALDIAAMVLAMPTALFPEAAATRFHGGAGLLYSAIAIGAIAAAVFSGWIGKVRRQGVALTGAVAVWALAVAAAGLTRTLWIAVALLMCAGAADLVSAVYRQTMLQTYAPDEMRGRMQGVFTVVVAGGPRLGDLRAGAMASGAGLTLAWSGAALACLVLVVAAALTVRAFWNYTTPAPPCTGALQPATD